MTLPGGAIAQSIMLEEITVTAQRRAEALQDVPLAITAFSEQRLQRLGITETLDLARAVPNFIAQNNTGLGTANNYSLRGLNNTESIATFDPPVGTYVDDFFIQRQNANNYALFDVDRIEVLRGPQGTLFGRNTTGGAVRIILRDPAEDRGGFAELGGGRYGRVHFRGSIDLPVSDALLTKVSGYYLRDEGFVENTVTGEDDINSEKNRGLRIAALWNISPDLRWRPAFAWIKTNHMNLLNTLDDNGGNKRFAATGLRQDAAPFANILTGDKRKFGLGNMVESVHFTSDLRLDTPIGTVSILTSYLDMRQEYVLDFFNGGSSTGAFTVANDGKHDQFSQELKLSGAAMDGRIDYVAGFFYFTEDNKTDYASYNSFARFSGLELLEYDRILDNGVDSWAAYGQLDFLVGGGWTLTAGLRYTDEDKDISITDNGNAQAQARGQFGNEKLIAEGIPLEQSESVLTPRVAIEYQHSDDLMLYVSATRGFKSGGWNGRGVPASELRDFSAEKVWSYEAGLRSEWLDNRLRVNLTGFYSDVSDFQAPAGFTAADGGIVFIQRNVADLEVYGLEVELTARPTDNLLLFANIGLMEAKYKSIPQAVRDQQERCRTKKTLIGERRPPCAQSIVNPRGDIAPPTRSPEHQIVIGGWYTWQLTPNLTLTPTISATRYGPHNLSTSGQDIALLSGYTLVNGGMTLEHTAQDWSLTASCRNCTDQEYYVSFLSGTRYLGDPTTWALTFNKRF